MKAGCRHIQVDEPVFAREPDKALRWGVKMLDRCFGGVSGDSCQRTVHICCGYPERLDQHDYKKADRTAYSRLAPALDASAAIDAVSIEDCHRRNDLALLEQFRQKTVVLGSITIANSTIETVEEIQARLEEALEHIEADRLIVAPDCGLGYLPLPILKQKLANMCTAARCCSCNKRLRRA